MDLFRYCFHLFPNFAQPFLFDGIHELRQQGAAFQDAKAVQFFPGQSNLRSAGRVDALTRIGIDRGAGATASAEKQAPTDNQESHENANIRCASVPPW